MEEEVPKLNTSSTAPSAAALAAAANVDGWGKGGSKSMIVRPKNCAACGKGVYPLERVQACEKDWHKQCFRCKHCNMVLTLKNFAVINSEPYCKPHYMELFKSKGNYAVFSDGDAKGGTGYTGGFFTAIGPSSAPSTPQKANRQPHTEPTTETLTSTNVPATVPAVEVSKAKEAEPAKPAEPPVSPRRNIPLPTPPAKASEPVAPPTTPATTSSEAPVPSSEAPAATSTPSAPVRSATSESSGSTEGSPQVARANQCAGCGKSVYPLERVQACEKDWHKQCFRCKHCNNVLSLGGFATINSEPYCKPHYMELFKSKGNYAVFSDGDTKGGTSYNGGFFTAISPSTQASTSPAPVKRSEGEDSKSAAPANTNLESKAQAEQEKEKEAKLKAADEAAKKKKSEEAKEENERKKKEAETKEAAIKKAAAEQEEAKKAEEAERQRKREEARARMKEQLLQNAAPDLKPSSTPSFGSGSKSINTLPPKCAACDKGVYPMERVQACDKDWHKQCFRCKHCNMVLSLKGFAVINSEPYCKPHYMEIFRSKGNYAAFGDSDAKGGTSYTGVGFVGVNVEAQKKAKEDEDRRKAASANAAAVKAPESAATKPETSAPAPSVTVSGVSSAPSSPATSVRSAPSSPATSSLSAALVASRTSTSPAVSALQEEAKPKASTWGESGSKSMIVRPPKCAACAKGVYPLERVQACDKDWHKQCFRCKHCNMVLSLKAFAVINSEPYCKPHYMEIFRSKGNYAAFGDSDAKGGTSYTGMGFTGVNAVISGATKSDKA